jgi:hypothetical protein
MANIENDRIILRGLAEKIAEIAALPVQEEKRRLWKKLNGLKPERPMVTIDQVCWHEMNIDGKLTLKCEDGECRVFEDRFRKTLFQWEYFPVDMVVEGYVRVSKALIDAPTAEHNLLKSLFGIKIEETTLATDKANDIVSHDYKNQFESFDDLEKIKMPKVGEDKNETKRRVEKARWLFDGILPVYEEGWGYDPYCSCWDPIAMWMSIEGILYGVIDQPDLMHAVVARVVQGYMTMLDQLEAQGLLYNRPQATVHTTGAWTDELPAPGYDSEKPRTQDLWMYAMAQAFATMSPAMFEEYEIEHLLPLFSRFGLVYYGCCDPLQDRMDAVKRIPHLRKISVSPWADRQKMAEQIAGGYVVSNKPNPAFLGAAAFSPDIIRDDLIRTRDICKQTGSPLEFAFKDISTVYREPLRLREVGKIAMEVAQG